MEEQDDLLTENDSSNGNGDKLKRLKRRSPNYPVIGLEKSLEKADTLRTIARHHSVAVGTAYTLWKYKKGTGDQIIAALKYFGLLDVTGEKENRQIRLTDAARRILGNAPDRAELLKATALSPSLHKEIWEKYDGDLPANQVLRDYLVWERNFNEDVVDNFINQFRETIAFANLNISDKLRDDNDTDEDDEDVERDDRLDDQIRGNYMTDAEVNKPARKLPPPPPAGLKNFTLHFMNNRQGVLSIPAEMSPQDYELLQQQINLSLAIIRTTSVKADSNTEPDPSLTS